MLKIMVLVLTIYLIYVIVKKSVRAWNRSEVDTKLEQLKEEDLEFNKIKGVKTDVVKNKRDKIKDIKLL